MFHFYNTCLNSFNTFSPFSGGIIISRTFLAFSLITDFVFTILSSYAAASTILFPNLLDNFLANDKSPYPLRYFFVLGYRVISIY